VAPLLVLLSCHFSFLPNIANIMGNAHGHVINDTEERHRILTFNYGDEIRHEPANVYDIEPFQTVAVSAEMCPIRGLIVATGIAKSGRHCIVKHDDTIKISVLLRKGNDNPAYEVAVKAIAQASCTNIPTAQVKERYNSVQNGLREEARKAERKYNRKPVRVYQDGVVLEAIQSSLQAAGSTLARKSSQGAKEKDCNESVESEQNSKMPLQSERGKKDE